MGKRWEIAKEFHFEYGHRVWTQELDAALSLGAECACRHLHGHSGVMKLFLVGENLRQDMVFDFKNLEFMKKFVDSILDHKMILDINDPYTKDKFISLAVNQNTDLELHPEGYYKINKAACEMWKSGPWPHRKEIAEGLVFVDFVPTSERICEWLYYIAQEKLTPHGVKVARVQFFETKKSESNFYP